MNDIKEIWKELARLKVFGNNKAIKDLERMNRKEAIDRGKIVSQNRCRKIFKDLVQQKL